ncbi:2Fe-2S iron-sulfur cluster binding domain-containing protein [Marinitoga hydrogenitolerans DSM 16785]|uniref:2Fe-2S iron-sulfur cluster binding domain-containing protein n=1 Tax=Marinitoga hydrogenitolerans (strain DSM 16785 / JCM 12826 / AT1271) TaxID=1122195 RepID=A0A1M5AND5_MARH1|nr:(2Fe-2S)-binding protein [Marinitoga hydrogenitolerans]SHF31634.1 2Fe-2S iron-sulfur cluster binding domain-containing protein [Marinitoga hydrogenitolerans DSM 16785]
MRIQEHPILEFKRGKKIKFYFEGRELYGYEGETIAAALYALGIWEYRESLKTGKPRGLFCAIGHCSSCLMVVNGIPNIRICVTPLKEGMVVKKQKPKGDLIERI